MKKVIQFIIDKQLVSLDDYPSLAEPITKEFDLDLATANDIINTVIEWECSSTTDSLEEVLNRKYPNFL